MGRGAAAAMSGGHRRFFWVALIRSAFRTDRSRFSQIVKLRVAPVAGVLLSKVWHVGTNAPGAKSGETLALGVTASKYAFGVRRLAAAGRGKPRPAKRCQGTTLQR